ncbi:MAG: carboxy terminal-processing peptidase [Methylococcales bacterium]|jgi:carboxyl-terminal processing protease|nr:carboxy terminal-processing peptidase [Methylococcales bacterium]
MRHTHRLSTFLSIVLLSQFVFSTSVNAKQVLPDDINQLASKIITPKKHHRRLSMSILSHLKYIHYNEMDIDDDLSSKVFDHYMDDLDKFKLYFLESDVSEFEQYRYELDDLLSEGNIAVGFNIFNRFQERKIERFKFMVNTIEKNFDSLNFTTNERMVLDREEENWAKSKAELDKIWKKRLKNSVINLKLTNKKMPEIKKLLTKRYRSQLNRGIQVNNEDVFQIFINSLTQSYDPHTQYFSPRTTENFNINMSLSLEGIGAVLQNENDYTKVVRLVPAGPADKANQLKSADRIVGVGQGDDGEIIDVIGWRIGEVVELIRGPKGSVVRLQIIPSNAANEQETKIIKITRNTVKLEEQAAQKKLITFKQNNKNYKMGVIDIPTFYVDFKALQAKEKNYKSTTRDVKRLIKELQKENIDGLVIDLRNNGGGSLKEVNSLVGLFIKKGPTVQIKNSNGQIDTLKDPDSEIFYSGPLIVLVNRLSASASEIFAGAIQDYRRGIIVGGQTFGKGTVQALRPLKQGQLKITLAKFYRISGESNQNKGIIPDITYPEIYDKKEIGESSLDHALPWDKIKPLSYKKQSKYQQYIAEMTKSHQKRALKDPDFIFLNKNIMLLEEAREKKTISLNEKTRETERIKNKARRLKLENDKRLAKGEKLLKKLKDDDEEKKEKDKKNKKPDAIVIESGRVLADYINLSQ